MRKVRKAPPGSKPSYETVAARLKKAEADLATARERQWTLVRDISEQTRELHASRTTIETLSEMLAQRVNKERCERSEPIPF